VTRRLLVLAAVSVALAACAQTLPEHDNRIFTAVPIAKLSSIDLAQAFVTDSAAATNRFVGKAIEVSGLVRDLTPTEGDPGTTFLLAAGDGPKHVRVSLHEDRAAEIAKGLTNGQRATFRCFCEGVTDHIQLKSCVVP
jgi:hypothetical protein